MMMIRPLLLTLILIVSLSSLSPVFSASLSSAEPDIKASLARQFQIEKQLKPQQEAWQTFSETLPAKGCSPETTQQYESIRSKLWESINTIAKERQYLKQHQQAVDVIDLERWEWLMSSWHAFFMAQLENYHQQRVQFAQHCPPHPAFSSPKVSSTTLLPPLNTLPDYEAYYETLSEIITQTIRTGRLQQQACDTKALQETIQTLDTQGPLIRQAVAQMKTAEKNLALRVPQDYGDLLVRFYDLAFQMLDARNAWQQNPLCHTP